MNHLAHFYLAGEDKNLSIGNYIADQVKGKKKNDYSLEIQKGIEMHRSIDAFTDSHPIIKDSISILKPTLGRYSSVAIDVINDHYLAKFWNEYSNQKLQDFVDDRYALIDDNYDLLPHNSQRFYHFMTSHNILFNYQYFDKLEMVFQGMSSRTKFESDLIHSVETLKSEYQALKSNFETFFVELDEEFKPWKE
ncbi:MAG: ACP phosphodiesterase [Salibacteraceae bacterium]